VEQRLPRRGEDFDGKLGFSRSVGAFLGLRPQQSQSGNSDPEHNISKTGNQYLRRLLVQAAHTTLGRFGPDSPEAGIVLPAPANGFVARAAPLGIETGGGRKTRQTTSGGGGGPQTGRAAAPPVAHRTGLPQLSPRRSPGGRPAVESSVKLWRGW